MKKRTSIATEFKKGHGFIGGGSKKGQHNSTRTEFKKGQIPWNQGKKCPQISKTRKKLFKDGVLSGFKNGHILNREEKHPNWKGGISREPYSVDWTETLRRSIRERDHYICQLCGIYGNTVHHIDYDKKNCDPTNLITLCNKCNIKVNKNREFWTNSFQKIYGRKNLTNLTIK